MRIKLKYFFFKIKKTKRCRNIPFFRSANPVLALDGHIFHFKNKYQDKSLQYVCKNLRYNGCKGMFIINPGDQTIVKRISHSCNGKIEDRKIVSNYSIWSRLCLKLKLLICYVF